MLNTIYDNDSRFGKYLRLFIAESYQEREQIAKGDKILMEFVKTIRDYCNNEEFAKYFTDEYWNKRIYHLDGLQEGKILGIQEMVREMLKNNYSLDDIMKISKLSLKEIEEIKRDFEK